MALETETRERFKERVAALLSHGSSLSQLTKQLVREGYSADTIPGALKGVGVSVDGEGRASMEPGPRQTRLK